jgi:8-oxo-dGTP pyrophosphatase MutT (NUDIX family)
MRGQMNPEKAHYVVVTGIIIKGGKYLITKFSDNHNAFPGQWTVPGGKLEFKDYKNENKDTSVHWYNVLEKVLKREVKEETGLEIKNINYLCNLTFVRPDGIPVVILSLYADHHDGEVELSDEMTDHKWVDLIEAKNYNLIEGIFDELIMLEKLLKGEKVGEWEKS